LQNTNFLNEIYQSVQLSIEEIENVLYCIKNQKIFKEIKKQKEEYEKVLIICQKKFKEELKEVSFIFKIGSNIVSQIKLMKNSSDKEILKILLDNSYKTNVNLQNKILNLSLKNDKATTIAKYLVLVTNQNIKRIKKLDKLVE